MFLDIVKEERKESSYFVSNLSFGKVMSKNKLLHNDDKEEEEYRGAIIGARQNIYDKKLKK